MQQNLLQILILSISCKLELLKLAFCNWEMFKLEGRKIVWFQ